MRWSARTIVLVGLGVGVAVSGAAALWRQAQPNIDEPVGRQATDPTKGGTPKDIAALEAKVAGLKADKEQLARLSGELKGDLTTLHSRLAQVDRDRDATSHKLTQLAEKMSRTDLQGSPVPARDDEADGTALTLEQAREREAARTQAEIELMEGTMLSEKPDPAWASSAQLALQTTLQKEAIPGVQMVEAECRTTLCRMELSLDGSIPQDNFRNLVDLAPWSGQSLIQIDTETGLAVMYLAREEHSLPQLTE